MARTKRVCKNHPHIQASRQCYYCKDAICPQCQQTIEHHIFCGKTCYSKWRFAKILKKVLSFKGWTPVFITFLILANILMYFYFENRIENLYVRSAHVQTMKDSAIFHLDSTRYPLSHILKIRVQAPSGRLVSLWRDTSFVASAAGTGRAMSFKGQILHSGKNRFALYAMNYKGENTLIDSFNVFFDSQLINFLKRPVSRVRTKEKAVAFTFDAGWVKTGAKEILEILRRNKVRCTIFLTGEFMSRYPRIVEEIAQDGHEIGNHSLNHPHLTLLEVDGSSKSRARVERNFIYHQLLAADSMYFKIAGKHMAPLWRAPFGELNKDILLWSAEAGYKHIGWSSRCDTWDWVTDSASSLYRTNREILEHILSVEEKSGLQGKIILMHFGTERKKDFPYLILDKMIKELKDRGYRFKKVSRLLECISINSTK